MRVGTLTYCRILFAYRWPTTRLLVYHRVTDEVSRISRLRNTAGWPLAFRPEFSIETQMGHLTWHSHETKQFIHQRPPQ